MNCKSRGVLGTQPDPGVILIIGVTWCFESSGKSATHNCNTLHPVASDPPADYLLIWKIRSIYSLMRGWWVLWHLQPLLLLVNSSHHAGISCPWCPLGASGATYCTNLCCWRGAGCACTQNSFFLRFFIFNTVLKISFSTLKEPGRCLKCLLGVITTLFLGFLLASNPKAVISFSEQAILKKRKGNRPTE